MEILFLIAVACLSHLVLYLVMTWWDLVSDNTKTGMSFAWCVWVVVQLVTLYLMVKT